MHGQSRKWLIGLAAGTFSARKAQPPRAKESGGRGLRTKSTGEGPSTETFPGSHGGNAGDYVDKKLIVLPSMTAQVRRPVAKAPVSTFTRFGRSSGSATGVWPCTIIMPKSSRQLRNSSRIQMRS